MLLVDKGGLDGIREIDRDQSLTRLPVTKSELGEKGRNLVPRTQVQSRAEGDDSKHTLHTTTGVMGCDIFVCVLGVAMAWPCHRAKPFRGGKTKAEWLGRRDPPSSL